MLEDPSFFAVSLELAFIYYSIAIRMILDHFKCVLELNCVCFMSLENAVNYLSIKGL